MDENVVSYNNMGEKYDFIEYSHARKVVKDFPAVIYILEKLIPALEEKSHYTGVHLVLQAARDSHMTMKMQYDYYKKIYDQKGRT